MICPIVAEPSTFDNSVNVPAVLATYPVPTVMLMTDVGPKLKMLELVMKFVGPAKFIIVAVPDVVPPALNVPALFILLYELVVKLTVDP